MQNMGPGSCPYVFNFVPETFSVGDTVSYRVTGSLSGCSFPGTLLEVHEDHVILTWDPDDANIRIRGTRESRPLVDESEIK